MEALKAALIAFLRKQTNLSPVEQQLDALLTKIPGKTAHALALLKKASDVGLSPDIFEQLHSRIQTGKQTAANAEKTFSETVVLPSSPRITGETPAEPRPAPPPPPVESQDAFLETVVLPSSPRVTKEIPQDTSLGEDDEPFSDDSDATVLDTSASRVEPTDTGAISQEPDETTQFNTQPNAKNPPPRAPADTTLENSVLEDSTTVNPGVSANDATQIGPPPTVGEDRTMTAGELDATQAGDFDILDRGSPETGRSSTTSVARAARRRASFISLVPPAISFDGSGFNFTLAMAGKTLAASFLNACATGAGHSNRPQS